jgi:hypothetical protein
MNGLTTDYTSVQGEGEDEDESKGGGGAGATLPVEAGALNLGGATPEPLLGASSSAVVSDDPLRGVAIGLLDLLVLVGVLGGFAAPLRYGYYDYYSLLGSYRSGGVAATFGVCALLGALTIPALRWRAHRQAALGAAPRTWLLPALSAARPVCLAATLLGSDADGCNAYDGCSTQAGTCFLYAGLVVSILQLPALRALALLPRVRRKALLLLRLLDLLVLVGVVVGFAAPLRYDDYRYTRYHYLLQDSGGWRQPSACARCSARS